MSTYSGLPYLLHTPPALLDTSPHRPPLVQVKSLARANSILKILTTMLQLLITFQPTSPAIAHGRALLRPSTSNPLGGGGISPELALNAGGIGNGRPGHFHAGGPGGGPVRRRATISITLHLDSLLQLMLPLFFLTLKLAFLLFIFARHASPTKRTALIAMAVGWVLWEGVAINRRRRIAAANAVAGGAANGGAGAGGNRDRERERDRDRDRERRRMARYLADQERANQQGGAQIDPAVPAPQAGAPQDQVVPPPVPATGAQPPRPRRAAPRPPSATNRGGTNPPTRREPHSVLSPKYWINSLAAVGLVAEARELGLSPRYIAGRPIAPVGPQRTNLTRWERKQVELRKLARMVWTGFVLFFATLVPEIERKRKKALEKRERLLAEKKVRWEKEKADREERHRIRDSALRSSATSEPVASGSGSESRKRNPAREGRNAVSDQELFKDGGSEASGISVPPAIASTSTSPQPTTNTSQDIPSTSTSETTLPDSTASLPHDHTPTIPATPALPDPVAAIDSDTENDEGDGDIAASASVSDNSDDEDEGAVRRQGQDARGNGEGGAGNGEGEAAVVAIF